MIRIIMIVALALVALLPATPASADHYKKSVCEQTADTMAQACRYDVRDNYYVTLANCQNMGDRDERRECFSEAYSDNRDETAFCGEVQDARLDACEVLNENRYDPDPLLVNEFIDPNLVPDVYPRNPYVSVAAGHTYVLQAGEEAEETVVVHVTEDTREILGVQCRVIVDIVLESSVDEATNELEYEAVEVTNDWFAQSVNGDVVYCGEVAMNFEDGVLRDLDGSFEAGLDFAKSGFLVLNSPVSGLAHRQEFALGEAEDIVQYVNLNTAPSAEEGGNNPNPAFSCGTDKCLQTFDFAPINPESTEHKYYLPGTGFVLAVAMEDGELTGEREELLCVGDSLDVLTDDPDCGIDEPERMLETLCALAPETFCAD